MLQIACRTCGRRVLVASLGGPVGTLASLGEDGPVVLHGFAQELGLGVTPLCWHTSRGRVAEIGAWLVQLTGALAKMATDVVHLVSTEVGEAAEPPMPGRGGSSAMPHKRNPVGSHDHPGRARVGQRASVDVVRGDGQRA